MSKIAKISEYRSELPDNYDPDQGLKAMAVAEAAENYYRRAKDVAQLYAAVETKLGEQRRFVLWWDEQEKQHGELGDRDATQFQRLDDLGVSKETVYKWRTRLADSAKFDHALEAAQERCRRVCEADKGSSEQRGTTGTGDVEWFTPAQYVEAARSVMGGIDLDPASSAEAQETVKAERYYTPEDDGLAQEWCGRIFLNPPYAQPFIVDFTTKLVEEWRAGRVRQAIMVTHNSTDTAWFHDTARACVAVCFTKGRVYFTDSNGQTGRPAQGQAFFYFGPDAAAFKAVFDAIGLVMASVDGE